MKFIKNWVEKIVVEKISEVVGKKPKYSNSYFGLINRMLLQTITGSTSCDDEKEGTGIFRDIDRLEDKVAALEKHLGIAYKEETKEFKGYKSVKKSKKK
jgi:hypothetical protein